MSEMPPPLPSETDEEATETTPSSEEEELEPTSVAEEDVIDPAADPSESLFEEDEGPSDEPSLTPSEEATIAEEPMTASYAAETPAKSEKQMDTQLVILIAVIAVLLLLCCCCATLAFFWFFGDQIFGLTLALPTLLLV